MYMPSVQKRSHLPAATPHATTRANKHMDMPSVQKQATHLQPIWQCDAVVAGCHSEPWRVCQISIQHTAPVNVRQPHLHCECRQLNTISNESRFRFQQTSRLQST
jgi:hypothetical protein